MKTGSRSNSPVNAPATSNIRLTAESEPAAPETRAAYRPRRPSRAPVAGASLGRYEVQQRETLSGATSSETRVVIVNSKQARARYDTQHTDRMCRETAPQQLTLHRTSTARERSSKFLDEIGQRLKKFACAAWEPTAMQQNGLCGERLK